MKKVIIFIFIIVLFNFCTKQNDPQTKDKSHSNVHDDKRFDISLNFKLGAIKEYKDVISLSFDSISVSGLSTSLNEELLKFTNNKGLQNAIVKLIQERMVNISTVTPNGSAKIETKTTKLTIEDFKLNGNPILNLVPFAIPLTNENKPFMVELSKKGKFNNLADKKEIGELLGIKKEKFLKEIISLVNGYQKLPDQKIAVGESWEYKIDKNIPLTDLFPKNLHGDGHFTLKLKLKNTLEKVKNEFYYINNKFDGNIIFNIAINDGNIKLNLSFNGIGNVILDNNIGLEHSIDVKSTFDLMLSISSMSKHFHEIGNPKIETKGIVTYKLGPKLIKQ